MNSESAEVSLAATDLTSNERVIYETQLNQLQDQLLSAMIDKDNLASELRKLKEDSLVDKLQREVYQKNKLIKTLTESRKEEKEGSPESGRLSHVGDGWHLMEPDEVDVAREVITDADVFQTISTSRRWHQRLFHFVYYRTASLMDDFKLSDKTTETDSEEGDPLTVKILRKNISRASTRTKPIMNYISNIRDVLQWKSPTTTSFVFFVYMYCVWKGWLLSVVLFYVVFQLTINYWNRKMFSPQQTSSDDDTESEDEEDDADEPNKSQRYSAKFKVVWQVARKVQNFVGVVADNLEKFDNLLKWQQPEVTRYYFIRFLLLLFVSLIFENTIILTLFGIAMGIKLFCINFIYGNFPRVKDKYDTSSRLWEKLPTNAEVIHREKVDKFILPQNPLELQTFTDLQKTNLSFGNKEFCDLLEFPAKEHPLQAWVNGKRATIIDKDKSFVKHLGKQGKLYLTRSFLCFVRTHDKSESAAKNLIIPLKDIVKVNKAKAVSWFPGDGMALEVFTNNKEKPYMFGGMLHRDDVFDSIMRCGQNWNFQWATNTPTSNVSKKRE